MIRVEGNAGTMTVGGASVEWKRFVVPALLVLTATLTVLAVSGDTAGVAEGANETEDTGAKSPQEDLDKVCMYCGGVFGSSSERIWHEKGCPERYTF